MAAGSRGGPAGVDGRGRFDAGGCRLEDFGSWQECRELAGQDVWRGSQAAGCCGGSGGGDGCRGTRRGGRRSQANIVELVPKRQVSAAPGPARKQLGWAHPGGPCRSQGEDHRREPEPSGPGQPGHQTPRLDPASRVEPVRPDHGQSDCPDWDHDGWHDGPGARHQRLSRPRPGPGASRRGPHGGHAPVPGSGDGRRERLLASRGPARPASPGRCGVAGDVGRSTWPAGPGQPGRGGQCRVHDASALADQPESDRGSAGPGGGGRHEDGGKSG